ncbi:hypothetical protein CTAYLR_006955 [Chrysophaeum taylorii]|uniref:Uncharacterized protein n=1 Tax=Chrysophaeum taylorii TaxID=2483200 RepID=A0AAD7UDP8_9STRA|nr:hypothetical protein CTAYLR_006955 [Chrysophaeum taylorii]
MTEVLAPAWGGLVVFGEARYYGASVPKYDETWLSTELILADYASLLRSVMSEYEACPVISFGGSYGGSLTTFFRASYPSLVWAALASSAPVGYYDKARWPEFNVTSNTFSDIVAKAYDCLPAIQKSIAAIEDAPVEDVVAAFGVCSVEALGPDSPAELFQYALESLPQLNYPYPVDGRPGWPVEAACGVLAASPGIASAANVTAMVLGTSEPCTPALSEGPGGVPGDGPGPGSWGYQSCTQTLHQFDSSTRIREYVFSLATQDETCTNLYGLAPNTTALTDIYGGYALPNTLSRVFFSNGLLDPWSGGGFFPEFYPNATEKNAFCVMPNAAHHLDLRAPNPADPPDVARCRAEAKHTLEAWIADFFFHTTSELTIGSLGEG